LRLSSDANYYGQAKDAGRRAEANVDYQTLRQFRDRPEFPQFPENCGPGAATEPAPSATPLGSAGFPPNTIPGPGLPVYMSPDNANKLAKSLDRMRTAAAAGDRAGYDAARKDWDAGVANLGDQAKQAVDNTGRAQAAADQATLKRYQDNSPDFPQPPSPDNKKTSMAPLPAQSGYLVSATPFGGYIDLGGGLGANGAGGGNLAFAAPLGQSFGVSANVAGGAFAGSGFFDAGAFLYARDPSLGLIGPSIALAYSGAFGGVTVGSAAINFEGYAGRFTPFAAVGVAIANDASGVTTAPTTGGGLAIGSNIGTFAAVAAGITYYPIDNLALTVAFSDLADRTAYKAGFEYLLADEIACACASFFADGFVGNGNAGGVLAGIKLSFGPAAKSLIRRHREDDPVSAPYGINGYYGLDALGAAIRAYSLDLQRIPPPPSIATPGP